MTQKEEYWEETTIGHCFREPTFSAVYADSDDCNAREFLAVGQKSVHYMTSDPLMGGSSISKVQFQGRVGVVGEKDSDEVYLFIDGGPDDLIIEESMPRADAEVIIQDPEACGQFVVESLRAVLTTIEAQK